MDRRQFIALGAADIGSAAALHGAKNRPLANGVSAAAVPTLYTSQNGLLDVEAKRYAFGFLSAPSRAKPFTTATSSTTKTWA